MQPRDRPVSFFFFNDTPPTAIYTLSLHDALPISPPSRLPSRARWLAARARRGHERSAELHAHHQALGERLDERKAERSEEHTSELQSHVNLVCRLLLEKKKKERRRPIAQMTHHSR